MRKTTGWIMRGAIASALWLTLGAGAAAAQEPPPIPLCSSGEMAFASPAPALADATALKSVPFVFSLLPQPASYIAGIDGHGVPHILCYSQDATAPFLAQPVAPIVAQLRFTAPPIANTFVEGGRYLIQLYTNLGFAAVLAPPDFPLVPPCPAPAPAPQSGRHAEPSSPIPQAPKPTLRKAPVYPFRAEDDEIEGSVTVAVTVASGGNSTVSCISASTPPGWFEKSAVDAVSQWQFSTATPGVYSVTIKYRLE